MTMTMEKIQEARDTYKLWCELYQELKELERDPLPEGGWLAKNSKGRRSQRSPVEKTIDRKAALAARINAAADRWFAFEAELIEISKRSEEDDLVAAIMYYRGRGMTWEEVDRLLYSKRHGTHVAARQLKRWLDKQTDPEQS